MRTTVWLLHFEMKIFSKSTILCHSERSRRVIAEAFPKAFGTKPDKGSAAQTDPPSPFLVVEMNKNYKHEKDIQ